jgi:hypothetical protein
VLQHFFGKPIARRRCDLLHPEARRASPNDPFKEQFRLILKRYRAAFNERYV